MWILVFNGLEFDFQLCYVVWDKIYALSLIFFSYEAEIMCVCCVYYVASVVSNSL